MFSRLGRALTPALALAGIVLASALAGTSVQAAASTGVPKHEAPIPPATLALMQTRNTGPASPMLIRLYKREAELEVWKRGADGRYGRLKTFPICRWSGQLGPKRKEGDRQAPEGFYAITPKLMNPNSRYYLSFDTGFPNAYDRAQGATGTALMVHGTCSSMGCYAMTDAGIAEIYALMREAFRGGQKAVQLQAFPFRMTAENLVAHRLDPNIAFWRQLKEGSDRFEATRQEVDVRVAAGRYAFQPSKDPDSEANILAWRAMEEDHDAVLLEEGRAAIRTTYADGGQHPTFAALWRRGVSLGEVSRPEALAFAGQVRVLQPARPLRRDCPADGPCPNPSTQAGIVLATAAPDVFPVATLAQSPVLWMPELPSLLSASTAGGDPAILRPSPLMIAGAPPIMSPGWTAP